MEAQKSQDLRLTRWRPRGAGLCDSSLKAGEWETTKEPMFQSESEGWKKTHVSGQVKWMEPRPCKRRERHVPPGSSSPKHLPTHSQPRAATAEAVAHFLGH